MGKNGKFGKDYGKVVGGRDYQGRPGWKGPGFTKKAPQHKRETAEEKAELVPEHVIPVELQQLLLNIFRDSFLDILTNEGLLSTLQEVKNALFERDFERAFGKKEYLEAYSARWSPSRALAYQAVLVDVARCLEGIWPLCRVLRTGASPSLDSSTGATLPVACFGGGAAEVVAFGGFLRTLKDVSNISHDDDGGSGDDAGASHDLENLKISEKITYDNAQEELQSASMLTEDAVSSQESALDLLLIDSAQLQDVVHTLTSTLTTAPLLSKYASAGAKAANFPLVNSKNFKAVSLVEDILTMTQDRLNLLIGQQPMLLTMLFTLNELYTSSLAKTTAFLLKLTLAAKSGSILLVVDSPGSYSETTVGTEAKRYPMHWLMDRTLLDTVKTRGKETTPDWIKISSDESKWFRIPDNLKYPISLENMRFQIHIYRRA